jgi:hypothetical protein
MPRLILELSVEMPRLLKDKYGRKENPIVLPSNDLVTTTGEFHVKAHLSIKHLLLRKKIVNTRKGLGNAHPALCSTFL